MSEVPDNTELSQSISALPNEPGVYQYFDKQGKLIYVGKAKNLRKRVGSYFNRDRHESGKTALLVRNITSLKHIVVQTEFEALLLENSMIKEHQPRFNIQLRDDKTYPWICIKNEPFPRVISTRQVVKDGSEYFGPYASVKRMRAVLEVVGKLFKVRTCTFNLTQSNITRGKFKVCLEYHLGNCLGPCEAKQSESDYAQNLSRIRQIVKGDVDEVIEAYEREMHRAAERLDFEAAAKAKERAQWLADYQSKSVVVSRSIANVDTITIQADDAFAYINYMRVLKGAVVQSHSIEFKKKLDEPEADLVLSALAEMRTLFSSNSAEVLSNVAIDAEWEGVSFSAPQRGDKKALIDLSLRNVRFFMLEQQQRQDKVDPERHAKRVLKTLQTDLRMPEPPEHIECFDNSNFHGSFPVAACVVFKMAKPSKEDYRHFNIKTVEGPNDFASMEEVITRRYERLLRENAPLPQLVLVDGGKGQLSSATAALEALGLRGKITVIGIAKKLEEIFFPDDPIPLYIDKRSESLKLLQRLRNEAHRFGITHHRSKRSKSAFASELLAIPGFGEATAKAVLRNFGSLKNARAASDEQLSQVLNQAQLQSFRRFQNITA